MNKKELIIKLRSDYSNKIRPLVIKNTCDCCGSDNNLELHHSKLFVEQVSETLKELNLESNTVFSDYEVNIIRIHMLGKQIYYNNVTLCDKCHIKEHNSNGKIKIFNYKKNRTS